MNFLQGYFKWPSNARWECPIHKALSDQAWFMIFMIFFSKTGSCAFFSSETNGEIVKFSNLKIGVIFRTIWSDKGLRRTVFKYSSLKFSTTVPLKGLIPYFQTTSKMFLWERLWPHLKIRTIYHSNKRYIYIAPPLPFPSLFMSSPLPLIHLPFPHDFFVFRNILNIIQINY